tara:strand:+ start:3447 stop:3665 length:219 start_codon:yes stop_codon:yes gene_type:complete
MQLPTLEDFKEMCSEHSFCYSVDEDWNRCNEGVKTHRYIIKVIKFGGAKYKKIYRQAFYDYIDNLTERHDES